MTREEFLDWAGVQDHRYEFDGFQPVAMTGGTGNHGQIVGNVYLALCMRLYHTRFSTAGLEPKVATAKNAVRWPDALVAGFGDLATDRLVRDVVVVFEVISEASGFTDRITKLIEYQAVRSIRRYVMLDDSSVGLVVLSRVRGDDPWTATALIDGEILRMPEIGIEIPVAEFYDGTNLLLLPKDGAATPTP